jgi:hypothetical protein
MSAKGKNPISADGVPNLEQLLKSLIEGGAPWFAMIKSAAQALNLEQYRNAAKTYLEASNDAQHRISQFGDDYSKRFWTGHTHLAGAKYFLSLSYAEEAEKGKFKDRIQIAREIIKAAQSALNHFWDPSCIKLSFDTLFDGYDFLVLLQIKQGNYTEAVDTLDEMEGCVKKYRGFAPQDEETYQICSLRLFSYRGTAHLTIGSIDSAQMDIASAEQNFKIAKDLLQEASKCIVKLKLLTKENFDEAEAQFSLVSKMVDYHSKFSEGTIAQENGEYNKAVQNFGEAANSLSDCKECLQVGLRKYTEALSHLCSATLKELGGSFTLATKEYEDSSKLFSEAAEAFPTDEPQALMYANRARFYSGAANHRKGLVKISTSKQRQESRKSRRQAGILFFALWLSSIGCMTGAAIGLAAQINAFWLSLWALISFPIAALAATLMKTAEATSFLKEIISIIKKPGEEENKAKDN